MGERCQSVTASLNGGPIRGRSRARDPTPWGDPGDTARFDFLWVDVAWIFGLWMKFRLGNVPRSSARGVVKELDMPRYARMWRIKEGAHGI